MKALLFIVFILGNELCYSQTVIKATEQSWSGGVCCATGINYEVYIQIDQTFITENLIIEEIWLKGYGLLKGSFQAYNSINIKSSLVVSFGYSTTYGEPYEINNIKSDLHDIDRMPEFEGMALIKFKEKSKEFFVTVNDFEKLFPIPYP